MSCLNWQIARVGILALLFAVIPWTALSAQQEGYLPGGPLAGPKLAGPYSTVGFELALYPGSVEVYRAPHGGVRSLFDRETQLKNWAAPKIPFTGTAKAEFYRPPVHRKWRENNVAVVPCGADGPIFTLDLGTLKPGLYAVRVIGAVPTRHIQPFLQPLFVRMRVNDGLAGENSTYRMRIGYRDEFYSVAEFYFHAPEERTYRAEVSVDEGSKVELLVHNITLDDVLAGAIRSPIKRRRSLFSDAEIEAIKQRATEGEKKSQARRTVLDEAARLARDRMLWDAMPPLNAQPAETGSGVFTKEVTVGVRGMTRDEIEQKWGKWETRNSHIEFHGELWAQDILIRNRKLNLVYTMADLKAGRPLPGPYPFRVGPAGIFEADPKDPSRGHAWAPIAEEVGWRWHDYLGAATHSTDLYLKTNHPDAGRDAAVALVRWAYSYPTLDASNAIACVTRIPGFAGRDVRFENRMTMANYLADYGGYLKAIECYDLIFDYIHKNEALAQSLRRLIPSIRTSKDVIAFLDTHLVQHAARRTMRHHDISLRDGIAQIATCVGDNAVTDPWMDWLLHTGFEERLTSECDRNGVRYLGSIYYCQNDDGALQQVLGLQKYLDRGGNRRFDFTDPKKVPRPAAQCDWQLGIMIGGFEFPRIGDVAGPDKRLGATLPMLREAAPWGWRWSGDPRFAWVLKHLRGRSAEDDAAWSAIEAAAAKVPRAPWLDNRSRVLPNWCGILETGLSHDDFRFRRAVYVRAGLGHGHSHMDALDLQVVAHGLPMTVDGGQRSGYSKPNDRHFSRTHNTVEVDGQSFAGHAWVQSLADSEGAGTLQIAAAPPDGAKFFHRHVALIDVDEGQKSLPLPLKKQMLDAVLEPGITSANSYVFDVFRISGGSLHTYCFHAMVNDEFHTNIANPNRVEHVLQAKANKGRPWAEPDYLSIFEASPKSKFAGDAPAVLEATWRYTRDAKVGSEQQMLGPNFHDDAPRKWTRLHLLGAGGLRVLWADTVSNQYGYRFTNLMAQRRGDDLETVFPAIIEPYAGDPFLTSVRLVDVKDNESDARRAVAAQVITKNGRTDLVFADGRPEQVRSFEVGQSPFKISAESAYLSTDKEGLRQATLSGGSLLKAPGIEIRTSAREYVGKAIAVDYASKTLEIDSRWPAATAGRVFEIGTPDKRTSYTLTRVAPAKVGSTLTAPGDACHYHSRIESISADSVVTCSIPMAFGALPGYRKDWVASNEDASRFWRAEVLDAKRFRLAGGPVRMQDFAPANKLRLWEFGVGDRVRQATSVSVRRTQANTYQVTGDVDVEVTLKGKTHKLTADEIRKPQGVQLSTN
jgi:hypothetical protein